VDCDDATLLVAAAEARTLSTTEADSLHRHAEHCDECRALLDEQHNARFRWVVQVPEDALDDLDLLVLPVVDPSMFAAGDELARGGMGRIIRARDRRLGRDIAIKESVSPAMRARFEREVAITAQLQHPAIIPVYEAGAWPDGTAFYTMRLVSGGTLAEAIAATKTLEDRIALLPHVVALTDALAYAHARQIIHRDLKPGNVLVGEFGETVVIDWGLAKQLGHDDSAPVRDGSSLPPPTASPHAKRVSQSSLSGAAELTIAGSVMGTPGFMAPEQAAGADVDERADVYALGAILYNLLSGHAPYFDSEVRNVDALLALARDATPTALAVVAPRAPADLCAIADRAMARRASDRYPSAKPMAEELHRFAAGQLLRSREYTARELVMRWLRRHRAAVAVAAVALLVVAIGGVASVREIIRGRDDAEHALALGRLEQGRQLVIDGDYGRATPYLAAAVAALPGDVTARELANVALRDAGRQLAIRPGVAAAFSPDGRLLAVGRSDGAVDLVDATTGAVTGALGAVGGAIGAVDVAPDDDAVVTASPDGVYLRTLAGAVTALDTGSATDARFGTDGSVIVISDDAGIRAVRRDGAAIATDTFPGKDQAGVRDVLDVSPDRRAVLMLGRDHAGVWRLPELTRIATLPAMWYGQFDRAGGVVLDNDEVVERFALSAPDVPVVLGRSDQQPLSLLVDGRIGTSNLIGDIAAGTLQPFTVELGSTSMAGLDADHVITGGYDRTLRIWDLTRGARPVAVLQAASGTRRLIAAPGGARVASIPWQGAVELWNTTDVREPRVVGQLDHYAWRLAAGRFGVAAAVDNKTELFDPALRPVATVFGWLVAMDGDEVIVNADGHYTAYDARTGVRRRVVADVDAGFDKAAGRAVLYDARGDTIAELAPIAHVGSLVFGERGLVATGHEDGTIRIWDTAGGTPPITWQAHAGPVNQLVIRGDRLLSGSWDGTLRAWAWPTGDPLGIVMERAGNDVAVSPSGRRIASCERASVVDVWDTNRGWLVERVPVREEMRALAFVDENTVIATGRSGAIERIELEARPLEDARIAELAAAARWQLRDGRLVERP
jgi:WD40 repeat protein/tRNA A-37 threonylcarbamoyl transferase component Bud32